MAGASWVQKNILEPNPEADIAVTAVWFNVLPGDGRQRWDPTLLTDPRVVNYWDEDRDVGRWLHENEERIGFDHPPGEVVWDSYLLFDRSARWSDIPAPLDLFGRTVIADKDELAAALAQMWEDPVS